MKKYDIKLKIITPCISAGSDQKKAELRAPSIRGQLRHWFRVLGASLAEENETFGGIDKSKGQASKVIVRVKTDVKTLITTKKDGHSLSGNKYDYFLWPMRNTKKNPQIGIRGVIEPQTVEILIIDKSNNPRFEECLKAFLYFGALGNRSRRAYGSIFPESVVCNGDSWKIPSTIDELQSEILDVFKYVSIRSFVLSKPKHNYKQAVDECANFLKTFRCGSTRSGTPSEWGKNDHDIRYGKTSINYRSAVGLPLKQTYSSDHETYTTESIKTDEERWASPVCFKIIELDEMFYPIVYFLKDYFMPENTRLITKGENNKHETILSHDLLFAMMQPDKRYWNQSIEILI